MSAIRVSLFGRVRIEHEDGGCADRASRGIQALLGYLLLHRQHLHSREVLAGVFWGEQNEDSARGCLNTALWRLRQVLEPNGIARGTYLITTGDGEVGFNRASTHWLDVAVLEDGARKLLGLGPAAAVDDAEVRKLETALDVYTGDLLQGNYSDWALRERERLRELYLTCLARLVSHHRNRENYDKALALGHKILALDPLREDVHRELMLLYIASGQRALALRQYEACRDVLSSELDIEPTEETKAVYAQVGRKPSTRRAQDRDMAELLLQPLVRRLQGALEGLDQTRDEFQRALALVEKLMDPRARRD